MHLKSLTIQNIKNLSYDEPATLTFDGADGSLAGWHVLAGSNGSGKSTLLRAISLACLGPNRIGGLMGKVGDWLSTGANDGIIDLTVERGPYDAFYTPDEQFHAVKEPGESRLALELGRTKLGGRAFVLTDANGRMAGVPEVRQPHYGPWIQFDQTPGWFVAGFGPYRRLPIPGYSPTRSESDGPTRAVESLFRADVPMDDLVPWLQHVQLRKNENDPKAEDLLEKLFSLLGDGLLPANAKPNRVSSDGLWVRLEDEEQLLVSLSDGFQVAVGLVAALLKRLDESYGGLTLEVIDGKPKVQNHILVLIDEAETHLHPRWQRMLGPWFVEHFPNAQFIVSTHSPFICQSATTGSIHHFPQAGNRTAPYKLSTEELLRIHHGTPNDIYLSQLFGLPEIRSPDTREILESLAELEFRILTGIATEADVAKAAAYRSSIPPSATTKAIVDEVDKRGS